MRYNNKHVIAGNLPPTHEPRMRDWRPIMGKIYGLLIFAALSFQGLLLASSVDGYAHLDDSNRVDDLGNRLVSSHPVAGIDINMTNSTFANLSWLVYVLLMTAACLALFQR